MSAHAHSSDPESFALGLIFHGRAVETTKPITTVTTITGGRRGGGGVLGRSEVPESTFPQKRSLDRAYLPLQQVQLQRSCADARLKVVEMSVIF